MTHISYVDPATVDDPELVAIMERARLFGTPRPESQAIRLHNPPVMKAFNNAWEAFFRQGVTDHAIKELCRLYIAKSVDCQYCGGQRSVLARQQGATESQVDDILNFEASERFDDRERTALAWAMAIALGPRSRRRRSLGPPARALHRAPAHRARSLHRADARPAALPEDRRRPPRRDPRRQRRRPGPRRSGRAARRPADTGARVTYQAAGISLPAHRRPPALPDPRCGARRGRHPGEHHGRAAQGDRDRGR